MAVILFGAVTFVFALSECMRGNGWIDGMNEWMNEWMEASLFRITLS
jgi:hypothetical protein